MSNVVAVRLLANTFPTSMKRACRPFPIINRKHQFDVKLAILKIIACRFYGQPSSHSKGPPDFNWDFETLMS
jgi:hypothetical protein